MYVEIEEQYQAEAFFADMIESAFHAGLISGETESLIYDLLRLNGTNVH